MSEKYKKPIYQAFAKRFLFESYAFSGLPDKGFEELEKALEFVNKSEIKDSLYFITKADIYIDFTNYYSIKEDYKNQLKFLKLSRLEFDQNPDQKNRDKLLYTHYSNLAVVYYQMKKQDSAKHFALLSLSLERNYKNANVQLNNFQVLGEIAMKEKIYHKSLAYFKEAEKLVGYKNHNNNENLYKKIIEVYSYLKQEDSVVIYKTKIDSLKLNITENQNKSLHKLLNEKSNIDKNYIYLFAFVLSAMPIALFFFIRKNRILSRQEKINQEYLLQASTSQNSEDYSKLIAMLKNKDLAFMAFFEEVFPDFTAKILKIYPEAIQSEIEFFALLKLKLSTNDIAKYKFIEPKTVRNKKYLTKKKLKISKETDIYQWFNDL
ncbi:hypothetical protein [Kaistella sp.]|uniref:hypothetical protein n=1 Tax=Kaistella sp. TaxID=2782235 RepID=UPI003C4B3D15